MHCDQKEEIDAKRDVECPVSTSSENVQSSSLNCHQRYAQIHLEMLELAVRDDGNHQVLLNCISFLKDPELFEGNIEDIPDDTRILVTTAISKILFTPTGFSAKLKSDWLPQLPEFMQEPLRIRRRPRSLSAIPTHDPMSPPRTPRGSHQSPRSPDNVPSEAPLMSASPPKLIKGFKWFWSGEPEDEESISKQPTMSNN